MKRPSPRLLPLLLLFALTSAYANGVSPILNFFHKDIWLPASVVTFVIILFESGILRFVASYVMVFVLQIGLFAGWLSYAGHL